MGYKAVSTTTPAVPPAIIPSAKFHQAHQKNGNTNIHPDHSIVYQLTKIFERNIRGKERQFFTAYMKEGSGDSNLVLVSLLLK
jgi:predicted SAM-dependent methyltransferase